MLLGNSADFDAIRARYQSLSYPTPEQAAFNARRSSYQGLLTGSGYGTTMVPTGIPGEGVTFSVDPNTGQVITNIPQYDMPGFDTIYDEGLGLIGEDGLPVGEEGTGSSLMGQPLQKGGNGKENRDRIAAMRERSEMIDAMDRFNMLPGYEEPTLPGLLGIFESIIDNIDRDTQINKVMRDIEASKPFGVNKFGIGTSYKGSSGTDTSGGATPDTGPSGVDADTGKFSGGNQQGGFGGPSGHGTGATGFGGHGSADAAGNPGGATGTARF